MNNVTQQKDTKDYLVMMKHFKDEKVLNVCFIIETEKCIKLQGSAYETLFVCGWDDFAFMTEIKEEGDGDKSIQRTS